MMKKIKIMITLIMVFIASFSSVSVFADNPYGIVYEGGEPLGENNVQIEPEMIEGLTRIVGPKGNMAAPSSTILERPYIKRGEVCTNEIYYMLRVYKNTVIKPSDNIYVDYFTNGYKTRIQINSVVFDGLDAIMDDSEFIYVTINSQDFSIGIAGQAYDDSSCSVPTANRKIFAKSDNVKVFVEISAKVYQEESGREAVSDKMFLAIEDVDGIESYKLLNPDNLLSKNNMYAKSVVNLQNGELTDRYVSGANYIYGLGPDHTSFALYTKLTPETQKQGASFVFGYGENGTGVTFRFYAKQYTLTYVSDNYGSITGITSETLLSGEQPTGTTTNVLEPEYTLSHWIADQDVELKDGTIIQAGSPITESQLKQIIVHDNLTLTAIHTIKKPEPTPEPNPTPDAPINEDIKDVVVPNTGKNTSDISATSVGTIVFAIFTAFIIIARIILIIRRYQKSQS